MPTDYNALLGANPSRIVRPTSVDEVAALVREADVNELAVIPWGGGVGQTYGYLPRRADIVVQTGGLNRILAHEPGDLTVTVQAGATLGDLQRTLARHNQFLPLDPPHSETGGSATIGGIIAANAWGPLRAGYGTVRDWLIGLTVVDAAGRIVKGGGKVVKNVTGYDLPKLHVGALGTLGVIVEATFKVAPVPETSATLCFRIPAGADGEAVARFVSALHAGPHAAPALSVLQTGSLPGGAANPAPGERHLIVAFHGMNEVVRAARHAANDLASKAGLAPAALPPPHLEKTWVAGDTAGGSSRLRLRFTGRPGASWTQHEAVAAQGCWEWVRTFPGTGHTEAALRMGEDPQSARAWTFAWAKQHQTPVALLKAAAPLRNGSNGAGGDDDGDTLWWPRPPALALMRNLKQTLDPNGTLNPGRFVGRI